MKSTKQRRAEIRNLIANQSRDHPVSTQEQLRTLLADRGYAVTQATLSRDLAQLGARRAPALEGGTTYELPDLPHTPPLFADLVRAIDDNGALVVVHTTPGAAQIVASTLDRARLPEILGTIAGDDTIFLAPARSISTAKIIRKLRELIDRT